MEFEIIYEYTNKGNIIFHILLLVLIILLPILIIWMIKRKYRKFSISKQIILFMLYIFSFIPFIMLCLFLFDYSRERLSDSFIEEIESSRSCQIVEGESENFESNYINGQCFDSFSVNNVWFEYSDNVNDIGYHNTVVNGGFIKGNGQYLRITYITQGDKNLILKLEIPLK